MERMIPGLVDMCGCVLGGRIMLERALRLLSAEQKVKMLDSFSRSRVTYIAAAFGAMILYAVVQSLGVSVEASYFAALILPLVVLMAWSHVSSVRRLRALAIPDAYVRTFQRSRALGYVGIATFLVLVVRDLTRR
jgi:hypothetical protein